MRGVPSSPACPACNRSVFPAEAYMAADRRPFHKQCVKCFECTKRLSPATINEHEAKLFCNTCYANIFMPQDGLVPERMSMQVLPVGGTYSAAEEARRLAEQDRLLKEQQDRDRKMAEQAGLSQEQVGMNPVGMLHITETVNLMGTSM